jgi:hypothetical protein
MPARDHDGRRFQIHANDTLFGVVGGDGLFVLFREWVGIGNGAGFSLFLLLGLLLDELTATNDLYFIIVILFVHNNRRVPVQEG